MTKSLNRRIEDLERQGKWALLVQKYEQDEIAYEDLPEKAQDIVSYGWDPAERRRHKEADERFLNSLSDEQLDMIINWEGSPFELAVKLVEWGAPYSSFVGVDFREFNYDEIKAEFERKTS